MTSVTTAPPHPRISAAPQLEAIAAWPLDRIVDLVVTEYHDYVRTQVPFIERLLDIVVARDGGAHPQVERIAELFREMAEDLVEHLDREERVLFPYLRMLGHGISAGRSTFGPVAHPIATFEEEHRSAEAEFAVIRALATRYRPPANASPELYACYDALGTLDHEFHQLVALEERVLFPAAIRIEEGQADRAK